ncbi:OsmC family protein [uncultured Flavobacterium sp.]|uniref:OsmC family protein n=1 Tax=uncultured Flavobacterium sp. TaxID=165435 RepID=UPI0030CA1D8C
MTPIKTKVIEGMVTHTETLATAKVSPNILTHELFYPIDLFSASLGSCIVLYSSLIAKRNEFELVHINSEITREMANSRVSKFDIKIHIEGDYTVEQKKIIEHAAENCPVANSLHQDIKQNFTFIYS